MSEIRNLEPKAVWNIFQDLCEIPRPSKKEQKAAEFAKKFGEDLGLETIVDEIGNVIIKKPATPGMEDRKTVVLQGHLDMVPQANSNIKHNFETDVIMVDYINICASARAKMNTDSYSYITMIAQELRGLGQEFSIPVWSATQVNRQAFSASDLDMDDVAESFGLPAIADWLGAIISDDTLLQLQQIIIKQLKSRYSDKP